MTTTTKTYFTPRPSDAPETVDAAASGPARIELVDRQNDGLNVALDARAVRVVGRLRLSPRHRERPVAFGYDLYVLRIAARVVVLDALALRSELVNPLV